MKKCLSVLLSVILAVLSAGGLAEEAGDHYTVVVSGGSGDAWSGSGKG